MRSVSVSTGNRERAADRGILTFGLISGTAGTIVLVAATLGGPHSLRRLSGIGLYSAGLVAMLGFSLLYRSAEEPVRRRSLRRFDHAAIFAMIAGSATPFALLRAGTGGILVVLVLWAVAALGIFFKLCFPIGRVGRSALVYLVLGWAAAAAVGPALSSERAPLIVMGGVFYSLGVPFLLWRRLPYRLAIWHIFVIFGAACHYVAILGVVLGRTDIGGQRL